MVDHLTNIQSNNQYLLAGILIIFFCTENKLHHLVKTHNIYICNLRDSLLRDTHIPHIPPHVCVYFFLHHYNTIFLLENFAVTNHPFARVKTNMRKFYILPL